jgi:hypothetical protein
MNNAVRKVLMNNAVRKVSMNNAVRKVLMNNAVRKVLMNNAVRKVLMNNAVRSFRGRAPRRPGVKSKLRLKNYEVELFFGKKPVTYTLTGL